MVQVIARVDIVPLENGEVGYKFILPGIEESVVSEDFISALLTIAGFYHKIQPGNNAVDCRIIGGFTLRITPGLVEHLSPL